MGLYEDLGVNRNSSGAEIKKAFRRRAMRAHPDRKGGSKAEFQKIARAYEVLSDPNRRLRYDQDGKEDRPPEQDETLTVLAQLLVGIIDALGEAAMSTDVLEMAREHVKRKQSELRGNEKNAKKQVRTYTLVLQRLRRKTEGPRLLEQMLEGRIDQVQVTITQIERNLETVERVLKLIDEYSYSHDAARQQFPFPNTIAWVSTR